MNREHGSEVQSLRSDGRQPPLLATAAPQTHGGGLENARNASSESLRSLANENLRKSSETTSPLGLSNSLLVGRKHSPPSATQTFISANEHIRFVEVLTRVV